MVHQNRSNKKFNFMIEAVNTANLYSTRSSFLSLKANTDALDSTRSDILTLMELLNTSWTSITSLILEMLIFTSISTSHAFCGEKFYWSLARLSDKWFSGELSIHIVITQLTNLKGKNKTFKNFPNWRTTARIASGDGTASR